MKIKNKNQKVMKILIKIDNKKIYFIYNQIIKFIFQNNKNLI
jgi:hypothetical protein